jgi:hypothetical protein
MGLTEQAEHGVMRYKEWWKKPSSSFVIRQTFLVARMTFLHLKREIEASGSTSVVSRRRI